MTEGFVDLHTHTVCSDGLLSAEEVLERAADHGLRAISLTDHDTVAAYSEELFEKAEALGVELVPGIELSSRNAQGRKFHILGLLIDWESQDLRGEIENMENRRRETARSIARLLIEDGWSIDIEPVIKEHRLVAKPHITHAVFEDPANAKKLAEVFEGMPTQSQFIEATMVEGAPAYVRSQNDLTPEQAIAIIHRAGGVALLAHPSYNVVHGIRPDVLAKMFLGMGIDGFEALSVVYDQRNGGREVEHSEFFTEFAKEHGLVISGGSDFHFVDAPVDLGFANHSFKVPYSVLEELRSYKERSQA